MKKTLLKDITVFILILLIIFIICLFLPDNIAVHFNLYGEPDFVINKYFVLFISIIPYSVYWQYFSQVHNPV